MSISFNMKIFCDSKGICFELDWPIEFEIWVVRLMKAYKQ